jgi:hypothetical protein
MFCHGGAIAVPIQIKWPVGAGYHHSSIPAKSYGAHAKGILNNGLLSGRRIQNADLIHPGIHIIKLSVKGIPNRTFPNMASLYR